MSKVLKVERFRKRFQTRETACAEKEASMSLAPVDGRQ